MRHADRRPVLAALLAGSAAIFAGCPDDPTLSDDLGWVKDVDGAGTVVIDATSQTDWVYFSLREGKIVPKPADAKDSLDWDLGFQRYNIKTNGGVSGKGQGAAADLGELDQAQTDVAKVSEWSADDVVEDARTAEEKSMNSVLSGWYSYHFGKHELVSLYHLYAVRAADGTVGTFKVYRYYDDSGTAGFMKIVYRYPVATTDAPPDTDGGTTTDGGSKEPLPETFTEENGVVVAETNLDARAGRTYFAFDQRGAVTVEGDPKASNAWDLWFDDWLLGTNSGTSGGGQGGAKLSGTKVFADAKEAPADGWIVDDIETIGAEARLESTNGQLAGWFDYDPTNQKIRSFGDVVWIRTAGGKYAKLQIISYYHPDGAKKFYRLRWAYRADGGRAF